MMRRILCVFVVALAMPFSATAVAADQNNTSTYDNTVKQIKNRTQKARDQIKRDRKQYLGSDVRVKGTKQYPGSDIRIKDGKAIVPSEQHGDDDTVPRD